jgi:hypothetical protein
VFLPQHFSAAGNRSRLSRFFPKNKERLGAKRAAEEFFVVKTFYLRRNEDVSGKSGTGRIAQVAEFDDGVVVVHWNGDSTKAGIASTEVFNSLDDMMKVHGHEGRTVLEPICPTGEPGWAPESEFAVIR